jgi:Heterokaryon incompatibility protein (HET)
MNFLEALDDDSRAWEEEQNEVVKAGKSYQHYEEIDNSQDTVFETRLSGRQAHVAPCPDSTSEISHEGNIYHPLKGEHEMRVLELYADEFDALLRCQTHVCTIEVQHPFKAISHTTGKPIWYTALSYVWGSSAFVKPMICDGKPFKTTVNLDLALRYLRRTDVSVMLWVDQICINQEDVNEKTQQVLLMGQIYQRAWNTRVWLGEEADNSDDAIHTIETVSSALLCNTMESSPNTEDFQRMTSISPDSHEWLNLSRFLGRPWFRRVWIIQEVVLSARVQLQCGRRTLSWSDMTMLSLEMIQRGLVKYLVSSEGDTEHLSEAGCIRAGTIGRISNSAGRHDQWMLLDVLVEARGAEASDPRDKVFGIMKMTETTINPDYSKEVSEVYTEAARRNLPERVFDLLCCVDHEPLTGSGMCCPSWVPNWSTPRKTTSLGYNGKHRGVYYDPKDRRSEVKQVGDRLSIVGILYDNLSRLLSSTGSSLKDLHYPTSSTAQFIVGSMRIATNHSHPYPSDSTLFDAFWHTVVAGKDHSGFSKAPTSFAEIFALLIDSATGQSPSLPDQPTYKRRLTLENLKTRRPSSTYQQMQIAFEAAVRNRQFGTTAKRYMGLFPQEARPADQICVFVGGHIPFVVRPCGTSGLFQLIGECYVHGIMDGEVMQMTGLKRQEIRLV